MNGGLAAPDGVGGCRLIGPDNPGYDDFASLHQQASQGVANFEADMANWASLTDAQKLNHVYGLMQAVVGILKFLAGLP